MTEKIYIVEKEGEMMSFLIDNLKDKSRTTIKSILSHRQVEVNGRIITQFNYPLNIGDKVAISNEHRAEEFRHSMMRIVFEDEYIIIIDKQSGLLSMGTDREREKTAYYILSTYVKKQDIRNRIFIVHRLDRETSGLMMFAKSEKIKLQLQQNWENVILERKYVAVAEGTPAKKEGVISTYLTENKGYKVFVSNKNDGDPAVTLFKVLKSNADYSLLELELETGRKNQIRAHLEYIGHPIAGDKKYGAKTNPIGRVTLHAHKLSFVHPVTGKEMLFSTPIPGKFSQLVK